MEWNELRAFLAVADSGSFSRAADRLNLTQPAVSKRIQALETHLGARLFDRAGKKVFLTDAGELLIPRARDLLQQLGDTRILLQNRHGRIDGPLRLATSHHAGLHRLAPVLRRYSQDYPNVRLDLRFVDSEVAHTLVRSADVDLAVVTLNPAGSDDLDTRQLWHDPLAFVAHREHTLHELDDVSLADLAAHQAILPGLSTFTGRIIQQRFQAGGQQLGSILSTNYLETIGMLVEIGLGWSVLPRTLIRSPITVLPVATPEMARTLGYVTHPHRTLPNAARAFIEVATGFAD